MAKNLRGGGVVIWSTAWILALGLAWGNAAARSLPDFVDLVKENTAAVVNISTTQTVKPGVASKRSPHGLRIPDLSEDPALGELLRRFFGAIPHGKDGNEDDEEGPGLDSRSLGSGFIISKDGYILTNRHVVDGADEIVVRLSDRREFVADLVGQDKRSDVALLKIDADGLPVVKIAQSKDLEVGEWVLAIGSPFGFDHSATAGIVSAKRRSLPKENYVPFIQTDVAINPGNSGGPLFNLDGEVVGVNSQIYSRTGGFMGLSFAIPIDIAMDVVKQLRDTGRVSRGWLGVLIQDVTRELAESFGMQRPSGALVAKVFPDGPAARAGVQVGDIILSFDGEPVEESATLPPLVGSTPLGSTVDMGVMRDGKKRLLKVKVGELPADGALAADGNGGSRTSSNRRLGLEVTGLDEEQRAELGVQGGVLVVAIGDGPARRAGLRKGDVVLELGGKKVASVAGFQQLVKGLPVGKSVAALVQRGDAPLFLALKLGSK